MFHLDLDYNIREYMLDRKSLLYRKYSSPLILEFPKIKYDKNIVLEFKRKDLRSSNLKLSWFLDEDSDRFYLVSKQKRW